MNFFVKNLLMKNVLQMDAFALHGKKRLEEVSERCLNNESVKLATLTDLTSDNPPYDLRVDTLKFFFRIVHIQAGTKITESYGSSVKRNTKQGPRKEKLESYAYFILGRCVFSNLPFVSFIQAKDCRKVFNTLNQQWEGETMGTNDPTYRADWLNIPVLEFTQMFLPVDYFQMKKDIISTGISQIVVSDENAIDRNVEDKKSFQIFFADKVDIEIKSAALHYTCQNVGCNGSHEPQKICPAPGKLKSCQLKFCLSGDLVCAEQNVGDGANFKLRSITEYFFDRDTLESGNLNDLSIVELRPLITTILAKYRELGCKWFYEGWFRTEGVTEDDKTTFFEGTLHVTDMRLRYIDETRTEKENSTMLKTIMEDKVGRYSSNVIRSGKDIIINVDIQNNAHLQRIRGGDFRQNIEDLAEKLQVNKENKSRHCQNPITSKPNPKRQSSTPEIQFKPKKSKNGESTFVVKHFETNDNSIPLAWSNVLSTWRLIDTSPEPFLFENDSENNGNRTSVFSPVQETHDFQSEEIATNYFAEVNVSDNVVRRKPVRKSKKKTTPSSLKKKFKQQANRKHHKKRKKVIYENDDTSSVKESDEPNLQNPLLSSDDLEQTTFTLLDDINEDNGQTKDTDNHISDNETSSNTRYQKSGEIKKKKRNKDAQIKQVSSIATRTRKSIKATLNKEKELDTNSSGSSSRWTATPVSQNSRRSATYKTGRRSKSNKSRKLSESDDDQQSK
jgi:hypothetical protein